MNFINEAIEEYAESHTSAESALLYDLNRETHLNVLIPRMLSGHLQGRTLSMLSHMIRPKNILEIGTYTGYSALCMAEGLVENGSIDTIDLNEELQPIIHKYWDQSPFKDQINLHIGNALSIIPTLKKEYQLVFIDADKENYMAYYHLLFDLVPSGGYILADNVLWSGNVLEKPEEMSESTKAITAFNTFIQNDERVENILLPIRDGLTIIRKK
ncbi:methyltransferase [Putridiphycobacter roseus]|uniref:Methyltransferase n=1 Tax=Putridiphycobacter roseus TaxID=2219161 RepID=A0A2W1N168_9FLAO|nr:O-methyltransferase [Putridiphycobacter roseus]PZE17290.1 methyltransferase [Putridiphycobacter roseus]